MVGSSSEDSDSGYHSPLHRKNQVTSGTQPGELVSTPVVNKSQRNTRDSDKHLINQPSSGRAAEKSSISSKESPPSHQVFSYAFIAQSKPVIESSVKMIEGREEDTRPAECKKTEGEESGNEGKRKRKRNRRRRKKKKEENEEGTERQPEEGSREVELHFQDEEEFPNLRMRQDNVGGPHKTPTVSYSAVLSKVSSLLIQKFLYRLIVSVKVCSIRMIKWHTSNKQQFLTALMINDSLCVGDLF